MVAQQKKLIGIYKRLSEITLKECHTGTKQCLLCPNKFPCKVNKASSFWEGDGVCLYAKREEMARLEN